MKVAGFTFIRNAIKYDFPIEEAIRSILPLCDEVVVALGESEDDTRGLIESIDPSKVRILDTVWDDSLREGGVVLARETDKAFQAIAKDADWAVYIQGDEVLHEDGIAALRKLMLANKDNDDVDGLLLNYHHFFGSYDYIGSSNGWYRHEIRVVKNNESFYSYRDAQGFRKGDNKKLNVLSTKAYVHHYGWVKEPKVMQDKRMAASKFWCDDEWIEKNIAGSEEFDYDKVDSLKKFTGTHPAVMIPRIKKKNWVFERDMSKNKLRLKDRLKNFIREVFGIQVGYKNYKVIR